MNSLDGRAGTAVIAVERGRVRHVHVAGDIDLEADDVTPRRDVVVALCGRHHEREDRGCISERVSEVELARGDVHSERGLGSVPLQKRASSVVQSNIGGMRI